MPIMKGLDANGNPKVVSLGSNGSLGTTNLTSIKLSELGDPQDVASVATKLVGYYFCNPNSVIVYIKLFAKTVAALNFGVDQPINSPIAVPALGAVMFCNGSNPILEIQPLSVAATAAYTTADTTLPALSLFGDLYVL